MKMKHSIFSFFITVNLSRACGLLARRLASLADGFSLLELLVPDGELLLVIFLGSLCIDAPLLLECEAATLVLQYGGCHQALDLITKRNSFCNIQLYAWVDDNLINYDFFLDQGRLVMSGQKTRIQPSNIQTIANILDTCAFIVSSCVGF